MEKLELRVTEVQVRHLISTGIKGCYGYVCLTPTGYEALAYTPVSNNATHVTGLASHGDGLNVIHDAVMAYLERRG